MIWSEYLPSFGFWLTAIELIKKDTHYIFAVPFIGIDMVGDLLNPINEIIYRILIVRPIHFDL